MMYSVQEIESFLREVDYSFPVPLSQKQDLHSFACKLHEKATICAERADGIIQSMVAGYTDNLENGLAYVSIVATLKAYQGHGTATKLVCRFLDICRDKGFRAVHLYAVESNVTAIEMYRKIGFVRYEMENETRPEDAHLIYYIKN